MCALDQAVPDATSYFYFDYFVYLAFWTSIVRGLDLSVSLGVGCCHFF